MKNKSKTIAVALAIACVGCSMPAESSKPVPPARFSAESSKSVPPARFSIVENVGVEPPKRVDVLVDVLNAPVGTIYIDKETGIKYLFVASGGGHSRSTAITRLWEGPSEAEVEQ